MKKTFLCVYGIFVLYLLSLCFLDYCNWPFRYFGQGKAEISVLQPIDLGKEEFVKILINIANMSNTDITYELIEDRGEYVNLKYYTTDSLVGKHQKNALYEIWVRDFKEITEYRISSCIYLVDEECKEEFIKHLETIGLPYRELVGTLILQDYISVQKLMLPTAILMASFIAMLLSRNKEFAIKKMSGYSDVVILKDICVELVIKLGIITVVELTMFMIMITIRYPNCTVDFLEYIMNVFM